MDKYELIELSKYSGSKNIICHLLAPKLAICLTKVECARSYIVAIDDGIRYCLTGNARIFDQDSEYVLFTSYLSYIQSFVKKTQRCLLKGYRCWNTFVSKVSKRDMGVQSAEKSNQVYRFVLRF